MLQTAVLPREAIIAAELRAYIIAQALMLIRNLWNPHRPMDPTAWFGTNAETYAGIVTKAQLELTALAATSTDSILQAQDYQGPTDLWADPEAFAGVDLAGRDVTGIAYAQALKVAQTVEREDATEFDTMLAWSNAAAGLLIMTQTMLSDTSRQAKIAQMSARPRTKYVRLVRPPCCARCAILAGKAGGENMDFKRHPGCDCDAVPVPEFDEKEDKLRRAGWIIDPKEYFDSLPEKQQNQIFTRAGAQAIRDGADINQIVNARRGMSAHGTFTTEGTTARGWASQYLREQYDAILEKRGGRYGRTNRKRLSVAEIYRRADNSDEALTMLHANGYLTDASPDLSGKYSFFLRDDDVKRAKVKVDAHRAAVVAQAKRQGTSGGGGKPPIIPPEVFKLIDEGDGDWRSRLTVDPAASKKLVHEWVGYVQLAKNGHTVHVLAEVNIDGVKNPDIELDSIVTEVKAPTGKGEETIVQQIRSARRQSPNVVIDLHRSPLEMPEIIRQCDIALNRYDDIERLTLLRGEEEVVLKWPS